MSQAEPEWWNDAEFNGDDEVMQYWRGVLDTCQYFKDELGIEDAMDTNMAREALNYMFPPDELVFSREDLKSVPSDKA